MEVLLCIASGNTEYADKDLPLALIFVTLNTTYFPWHGFPVGTRFDHSALLSFTLIPMSIFLALSVDIVCLFRQSSPGED